MNIKTDKQAQELVGTQVYIFRDSALTPTVVNNVILTKTFSGIGEPQAQTTIVTSIGEFPSEEIFRNRDELIIHIDKIIGREQ